MKNILSYFKNPDHVFKVFTPLLWIVGFLSSRTGLLPMYLLWIVELVLLVRASKDRGLRRIYLIMMLIPIVIISLSFILIQQRR